MVVNDDRSELTQGTWYSRLARERLDLSVSVKETLGHPCREQVTWQEECNEQTSVLRTTHGRLLFPPRLSLQSRPISAVDRTGMTRVSNEGPSDRLQSTAADLTVLMRFAQRLTSSFAALEIAEVPSMPEPVGVNLPFLASDSDIFRSAEEAREATTAPFSLESLGVTRPLPPVPSFTKRPHTVRGKQRLAGCAVRVRLETAPAPAERPQGQVRLPLCRPEVKDLENRAYVDLGTTSAHLPVMSNICEATSQTSAHLPVAGLLQAHTGSTSVHLSVLQQLEASRTRSTPRTFSGCHTFESGQSDVSVANPAITAASVVLVTLTENPGPVVLQYVSLQPGVGFTLHLTAPAARKAGFNYIILVGELFQDAS